MEDIVASIMGNTIEFINYQLHSNCILRYEAFYYSEHKILLSRLYQHGIRGIPHMFIQSYLVNRTRIVQVS
jgi:hypothetical protein